MDNGKEVLTIFKIMIRENFFDKVTFEHLERSDEGAMRVSRGERLGKGKQ